VNALEVRQLTSGYGGAPVLHELDLTVQEGAWVAVLGANGAGKTTLLRAISGLLPYGGQVALEGEDVTGSEPEQLAARGLGHVPENRLVFPRLSVEDNLRLGAWVSRRDRETKNTRLRDVYALFPRLEQRRGQAAGTLSGGEQQMLAVGRALMGGPRVLVLDEPSIGLAPRVIVEIFDTLAHLSAERGLSLLLVEQNAALALQYASYAYVLERGRVSLEGAATALREDRRVEAAYLGGVADLDAADER
jgi:branched-chain amino acid transport system ATP-binding protein